MRKTNRPMISLGATGLAYAAGVVRSRNRRAIRKAFSDWSGSRGSIFDIMSDDAVIMIPGIGAHCGTYTKVNFIRSVATPFMACFSAPPLPRSREIWSDGDDVAVLADAEGTTLLGTPYANSYVFILKMRGGRIVHTTEFLDMAAFNAVWDEVRPLLEKDELTAGSP